MARVTLLTIANEVGVSRTTVSNAYSRPDQLTPELRDKILSTAARLGYHGPNPAARMLRTGRIGTIGLIFTEDLQFVFSDPNTRLFMRGVAEQTSSASLGLTLLPVDKTAPLAETAILTTPVDGYLLFSVADEHPVVEAVLEREVPVVIVDEPDLGDGTSFVGIDDRSAAAEVGAHVRSLGHRQVAIIVHRIDDYEAAGPVSDDELRGSSIRVVRERYCGYRTGLGKMPIEPVLWSAGEMTVDGGRRAARTLLEFHPDVSAIICTTDQLAIGATQALSRMNRSIPNDVSVIGFDDIPRAADWDTPLTTMSQPLIDKGRLAAQMLQEMLDGAEPSRQILPTELVLRSSTGPAPSDQTELA